MKNIIKSILKKYLSKGLILKFSTIKEKLKNSLKYYKNKTSKTYYLSIGENCLTDNILDRHNLKSFSTPYSHGRSNLDYAIKLERENYDNLLNYEYLSTEYIGKKSY